MRIHHIFLMFIISMFALPIFASTPEKRLQAVLEQRISSSAVGAKDLGIWVGRSHNDQLVNEFSLNAERKVMPASLTKLITAGVILRELKPTHQFKTELLASQEIKDGKLLGDLYLKGGGDPSFVSENMWVLVNNFSRTGIRKIKGNIIVDDQIFERVRFGEDRMSTRVDRAFDAPVGAMSFNWNSVTVHVQPGPKEGEPVRVFLDVDSDYLRIENKARTVRADRRSNIQVRRRQRSGFSGDVIEVTGTMALGAEEITIYRSITQPDLWSGFALVSFLQEKGIEISGTVRVGSVPAKVRTIASVESKPLSSIVTDMMKWSNNYVAEMLIKNLVASSGRKPASMSAGLKQVREHLESYGFSKDEFSFNNGSGLVRGNHMTPQFLARFLHKMHKDFSVYPEFLASLPIAGVDGTLRTRMRGEGVQRSVRAKTGLLNGVVGLAGYVSDSGGDVRYFVFIYNGRGKDVSARALFDQMAGDLAVMNL